MILLIKRIIILIVLLTSSGAICYAQLANPDSFTGQYNYVPEPRLKYPISDVVTINDAQPLEFKWWNDYAGTRGYILKVYKGHNPYADNLILKEQLGAVASFAGRPDLFEDGKTYTWSLVRISSAGFKSDKSFNTFKVVKK
ncbi:MAG TPA: hypothetical protein PL125_06630 [Candidatus Omnitrophota bacterium]|nr:hypothetical protein [Candidatus Omnitrophota bacterium]HPT39850.1 hypothetical protein [Candidatus Omnitrophota bacterium]